jgi:hypothetical protein
MTSTVSVCRLPVASAVKQIETQVAVSLDVGNLPAILSAWSANILFAIAAVYMFLHVET